MPAGKHSPNQSLADILTNIERARGYLGGLCHDGFAANPEKVDAVVLRLQNASEASTRLRNRYRHGYDNVDVDRVWEDLDGLVRDVERAVGEELALSRVGDMKAPEA